MESIKPKGYWTKDRCMEIAKESKTLKNWFTQSESSYRISKKRGWFEDCRKLIEGERHFNWTLEECKLDALKYDCRKNWQTHGIAGYTAAFRANWLEECCIHMKRPSGISLAEKKLFSQIKEHFPNVVRVSFSNKGILEDKPHIKRFMLDLFIPNLNKGIEFDGTYWHSFPAQFNSKNRRGWPIDDIKNYQKIKDAFFNKLGIEVLHISEEDWIKDSQMCLNECLSFLRKVIK